jgi:streptogramin lyase
MSRKLTSWALALCLLTWASAATADDNAPETYLSKSIKGKVSDADGKSLHGVMITAFDAGRASSVSVYSQNDGTFKIDDASKDTNVVRARLIGLRDAEVEMTDKVDANSLKIVMEQASPEELKYQMRGSERMSLLKFDKEDDALNFRMMCAYCHQVGTEGFRTPEEPVDWEVMVTRMDGFGGLYKHTQETIVGRIVETFGPDAEKKWPEYKAPEPPKGKALEAKIYEWAMGQEDIAMIHDLEPGKDGLVYIVDMTNDCVTTLDPRTGERTNHALPGGKEPGTDDTPIKGPHSISMAANGDMWITLALSGQMAKFDPKTNEYTQVSSAPAPRPRGAYPHTLEIDQKGFVWYTDAGTNSVFSIDPETLAVKQYNLLRSDQAVGAGRGESRGITPYGISVAPNGHVWYSKLNGQRIGRIAPELPDGDANQIKEWKQPVHGPRRHHVAPNGLVWVPGWASGDFASFNPETEEWKVYKLPLGPDSLPYALNVHPKTGYVWVCGTGFDAMVRFIPSTEEMIVYNMPTRVTYTREVEFDEEGNIWVCNSNYPSRHIENHRGSLIKIVLPQS